MNLLLSLLCVLAPVPMLVALRRRHGEAFDLRAAGVTLVALGVIAGLLLGTIHLARQAVVIAAALLLLLAGSVLLLRHARTPSPGPSHRWSFLEETGAGLIIVPFTAAAWLALVLPITNFDSLAYHLPSLAHWVRSGSLDPVPFLGLQRCYPLSLMSMALPPTVVGRSDVLVPLVGLAAYPLLATGVFRLARQLGAPRSTALLATAVLLTAPVVLRSYGSAQPDAMLAALFAAGLSSWNDFARDGRMVRAVIFALTVALLPGFKATGLVYAALLVLFARASPPPPARALSGIARSLRSPAGGTLALMLMTLAGFWYLRALLHCGNPLGPVSVEGAGQDGAWTVPDLLRTTIAFAFEPRRAHDWSLLGHLVRQAVGLPFVSLVALGLVGLRWPALRGSSEGTPHAPQVDAAIKVTTLLAVLCLLVYIFTPFSADNGGHGFRLSAWSAGGVRYAMPLLAVLAALAAAGSRAVVAGPWYALAAAVVGVLLGLRHALGLAWPDAAVSLLLTLVVGRGFRGFVARPGLRPLVVAVAFLVLGIAVLVAAPRREDLRRVAYGPFFETVQRMVPPSEPIAFHALDRPYPLYGERLSRRLIGREQPRRDRHLWRTDAGAWEDSTRAWLDRLQRAGIGHLVTRSRDPAPDFDGRGRQLVDLLTRSPHWHLLAESGDASSLVLFAAAAEAPPDHAMPSLTSVGEDSGLPGEGKTSGAVPFDLDGDPLPDLLVGRHSGPPEAFRNLGDLRFERVQDWGSAIDVADHHATVVDDLDADGCPDLYLVVGAHRGAGLGPNALHLCADAYRVERAAEWGIDDPFGRGRGALVLDLDGDGRRELIVENYRTAPRAFALAAPERGGDRARELLGVDPVDEETLRVAARGGEPTTQRRRRSDWVHRSLPADFDLDGRVDLVAFGGPPVRVLRGKEGGVRADLTLLPPEAYLPPPPSGATGDVDGDGHPDLFLVYGEDDAPREFDRPRHNRLLLWRADGFVPASLPQPVADGGRGVEAAFGDLDGDGWLDLVVVQADRARRRSRVRIFPGAGPATFASTADGPPQLDELAGLPDGLLLEDLDRDGDLDLLLLLGAIDEGEEGGGVALFRNDTPGGRWLSLELAGDGARSAVGARAEVRTGDAIQVRQLRPARVGGSSYLPALHFGLGRHARADEVRVHWPTGQTTVLRDVKADQRLRVTPPRRP